jgi:hypothetical protein
MKTIQITVSGGVIQGISNIPAGITVSIKDFDVDVDGLSNHPLDADQNPFCETKWESKEPNSDNVCGILDVSTGHITAGDSKLILHTNSPCFMAEHYAGYGTFFTVPQDDFQEATDSLTAYGYSSAFINLFKHAHALGLTYLYLDNACPTLDGFPTFEW